MRYLPGARLALQDEIEAGERDSPVLRLHQQDVAEAGAGQLLVAVAEHDRVQTFGMGGDLVDLVFGRIYGRPGFQIPSHAGMRGENNQIGMQIAPELATAACTAGRESRNR